MITEQTIQAMITCARKAQTNAFVIRSGHKIGACALTTDGQLFGGCNIESIVMGLGTCAEQSAINNAVVHGKYQFQALLVVDSAHILPCGVCLQYLMQFYQIDQQDITIMSVGHDDTRETTSLCTLLPHGYQTRNNLERLQQYRQ
jgi:cytidine deaminase